MAKVLDFMFQLDVAMTGKFDQPMRVLNEQFSRIQQAAQKLNANLGDISAYQKLSSGVQASSQKLEALRQKTEAAKTAADTSRAKTSALGLEYRKAEQTLQRWTRSGDKHSLLMKTAQQRATELKAAYEASQKESAKLEREHQKLAQSLQSGEKSAAVQAQKLDEMSKSLQQAGVNTDNLSERQTKLQSALDRTQKAQARLSSIREQLTWGNFKADFMKSAAIVQAFRKPIQVTMNFDQAMAQVRAVKTMTDEEFARLETQAKDLGASTQFSATQAANTQENLARAGMSITDITAALPAVLSMAGAEGMDLAQAGSIIAKGLGGMSLAGDLAPRLADVLAYTSSSSNTNIAEIGDAFKVAAPVLSKQGATMEQIASYIGVMANKGYTGSEAGNALASTTMRLANLPNKAKEKLLGVGLDPRRFKTKEGRMVELPEIMKMIDSAMKAKNLGEFEQLDILSEVFGKNQGKAMSAFLSASTAGQADTMKNGVYNDSFGKAAEMNRTRNNTLKGDITALSSAWEGLMIAIGKPLDAVNRSVVQVVTELLSKTTKFINENKDLMRIVLRVGYIFGGWKVLGTVYKYGKLLVQLPFAKLAVWGAAANAEAVAAGTNIGLMSRVIGGLMHPITSLKAGFSGLWKLALAHPFGLIFTAGAALIGLIVYWDKIKAWWDSWTIDDVWAKLPEWAQKDLEACKKFFTDIYDWIVEKFKYLNPFNWELPDWMKSRSEPLTQQSVSSSPQGKAAQSTASKWAAAYGVKSAEAHAVGGIFSRPHIGLVAEAGPEAIIPLKDKSRAFPILNQAMQILGLNSQKSGNVNGSVSSLSGYSGVINRTQNDTIISQERQMINYVSQTSNDTHNGNPAVRDSSMTFNPTYNITVNGEGSPSIGENIRAVIEDTMNEIMSRMERVSYA